MQTHEQAISDYLAKGGEVHRVPLGRRAIRRSEMRRRLRGDYEEEVDAALA